jgi:purine-binding chemotaxis protein CheW
VPLSKWIISLSSWSFRWRELPLTSDDIEGIYMASVATLSDTSIVGENEEQLVTMIVDKQLFGIPILQVQDIVEASRITPVPLAPSAIAGVLNLRGRIVTVIDLRKLLGNNEEVPWDSQMGVTVEYKGDLYTLLVDAIGDVRTLPKRDFDSAPSTMEAKIRQICSGIFRLRGNLLVVLDVSRILLPEAIEATPMLSVEDRRARKQAAQDASNETKTERGRQLSTLMTDLNAYESDFDSGLDSLAGEDDDIKARKKANRNRRPVNERWQEVLDEKARRDGTVSFRMREPEEDVLEEAREEAKKETAGWEEEWHARQTGDYKSRLPEPDAPDEDLSGYDQPMTEEPAPVSEEPAGFDAPPAFEEPAPVAEEPTPVAEEPTDVDAPLAFEEPAPVAEEPTGFDAPPAFEEPTPDAEEPTGFDAPPAFEEPTPDAEEPTGFDAPLAFEPPPASEESVGSDVPPASDDTESPTGVGGVVSDWWSKMRGKPKSDDDAGQPAAGETPVELPAFDEPAADSDPASEDEDASAKEGKKTKKTSSSKAKGKTSSKAKKKK